MSLCHEGQQRGRRKHPNWGHPDHDACGTGFIAQLGSPASHDIVQYALNALERKPSSTARYWETDAGHRFGIIANESEPFCGDCDRLRLDSGGNIYGCLSSNHPIALDPKDDTGQWTEKLRQALGQKQAVKFTGSELSMLKIGG